MSQLAERTAGMLMKYTMGSIYEMYDESVKWYRECFYFMTSWNWNKQECYS